MSNRRIVTLLQDAADRIEKMTDDQWVHTVTVTLDGRGGVTSTIEWDQDTPDSLEHGEPITFTT